MSLYLVALFLHLIGAVLLFVTLGVEGLAIRYLSRATTVEQVRDWGNVAALSGVLGPLSAVTLLVTGLCMMITTWHVVAWIVVAVVGWLFVVVVGTVNGIRLARMARIPAGETAAVADQVGQPLLITSWLATVAVGLGVMFLMSAKPDWGGSVLVLIIALALGVAASMPIWARPAARTGR